MTIIPLLRRPMKHKKLALRASRTFPCESLESRRMLAIGINVGAHTLLPNTAGQVIEIMATANEAVTGMNFTAQIGDGDNNGPGSADEPDFTAIGITTGTVWDIPQGVATIPFDIGDAVLTGDNGEPSYVSASLILGELISDCQGNTCDVVPQGVIARITVDTTGFSSGTFPLLLNAGDPQATAFIRSGSATTIPANITNGTITVVNNAPIAVPAVSPATDYTIDFGGSLTLDGSDSSDPDESLGDSIDSYSWDINSATFASTDATGVSPTLSWSQLTSLGITTPGTYDVTLQVQDTFGGTGTATTTVTVNPATVASRNVFFNGSFWDGNGATVTSADLSAAAVNKTPLVEGGTPSFANYSGYTLGINGIMVALSNIPSPAAITANDFQVRVGGQGFGNDDPANWTADTNTNPGTGQANLVPTVTVLQNVTNAELGLSGEDVIALTWGNSVIQKQWVEVTVVANADTGLAAPDRFYFGNLVGDTNGDFVVDPGDIIRINNNQTGFFGPFPTVDDLFDIDKSGLVDPGDVIKANNNQSGFFDYLSNTIVPRSGGSGFAAKHSGVTSEKVIEAKAEAEAEAFAVRDVCFANESIMKEQTSNSAEETEEGNDLLSEAESAWLSAVAEYAMQREIHTALRAPSQDTDKDSDELIDVFESDLREI